MWPLSRSHYPKQFVETNGRTLLGDTLERCMTITSAAPIVVTNEDHRFYAASILDECQLDGRIVLEPEAHNTAPAVALAALQVQQEYPDESPLMLVMPSDHAIHSGAAFYESISQAITAAQQGYLVTFGIEPTEPATGFGYIIRQEEHISSACYHVQSFQEKPTVEKAHALIALGNCFWNSGIFLFRADVYLEELQKFAPEIMSHVQDAWKHRQLDKAFIRPEPSIFSSCPDDSVDYAVMERTDKAAVVPTRMQWSDLGSWNAFYQIAPKDAHNNASHGDVILEDSQNCYAYSSKRLIAGLGLEDTVIVETGDSVLVTKRERVEDVKKIVTRLKREQRSEAQFHTQVYRPWGSYECLGQEERFQVKRIVVNINETLSLQKHHHRSEHWIVVGGTAEVTVDEKTFILAENESTYIPLGSVHRLKNIGRIPLVLIEVQTGSYLGEDDIVRFDDNYGRVK